MNIYKTSSGKVLQRNNMVVEQRDIYAFELEVSGTSFPDRDGFFPFRVLSTGSTNSMYIDPNDGFGEREYIGNNIIFGSARPATPYVYFQDVPSDKLNTIDPTYLIKRKIKIRFKYPKNVKEILFLLIGVYGKMPLEFGFFDVTEFSVSNGDLGDMRWDSFPTGFNGFKSNKLTLYRAFKTRLNSLPDWFVYGSFKNVLLIDTFNLSGLPSSTGMDKIHNISGLESLIISASISDNSLDDNLKLIPNLSNLGVGGNNFTTLPKAISNCTNLKKLTISEYDGNGYITTLTSWGDGIGKMTQLSELHISGMNDKPPTSLPPGIENCVLLKKISARGTYTSQVNIDDFISNIYNLILNNASTISGNTKFRQMVFDIASAIGPIIMLRPSGTYQDSTTPSTPMEKIYKMVKVYGHKWIVRNAANTGTETLS